MGKIVEYRKRLKLYQVLYCFFAKASSKKRPPSFTDEEKASSFKVVWVNPKVALELLNLRKTPDYEGKFIEERDFCFLTKALQLRG